jgi:hypothetical protein
MNESRPQPLRQVLVVGLLRWRDVLRWLQRQSSRA